MKTWEEIRSDWVNGNRRDAKNALYQQATRRALKIVGQAIQTHLEMLEPGATMSGDLTDLLEIISFYGKGE